LEPYPEKPAGYYWLVALAYAALGVNEAAARAVSALAALVAVLALYAYALPRWGLPAALGAGAVAATSAGWFGPARYGNLDMTLTACVTVGVLGGLAWLERPAPRRAPLAPYVAAGLGLLVKGPLALVLVAGPLALAALVERPRPRVGELGLVRGTLAVVALGALLLGTELANGSPAEDRTTLRVGGALAALALLVGAGAALFAARSYLALSARVLLAAAALGWAVGLLLVLRRARLHLVPAAVLG